MTPLVVGVIYDWSGIGYTHPQENMRLLLAGGILLAAVAAGRQPRRAVVLEPVLDMYSKPAREADVVSQARYAQTVEVLEERGEFWKIKTPDEYPGWVEARGVRVLGESEQYPSRGEVATVEALAAHIYRENSVTRHRPLLTVPFETRLEVVEQPAGEEARWIAVRLPDDRKGWIQRGDVSLETRVLAVHDLIELARRFLGRPYTWGGTSSFGYDCSGFTQMLCRRGGRDIPRDSSKQAVWEGMMEVRREDLQAGDLLYFGPTLARVNHTGFYIGKGEFIHSTTNGRPVVQISRLDDEPWTRLLVACRRWTKQ